MDATTAAARMLSEPNKFFRHYPVMMAGGSGPWINDAINLRVYHLSKKWAGQPGSIGNAPSKEGHFGATRPGFLHTKNISSFKMEESVQANCSGPLNTHGVPMLNYDSNLYGCQNLNGDITAMPHFVAGAGADYITTGLLTGCCFAWIVQGGELWCTHVQPKDGIIGVNLHNQMNATGRFAAAPLAALSTFGHNNYVGSYAVVIGVKVGGNWRLYAQTSSDQFKTITAAWRIHPGPMTPL